MIWLSCGLIAFCTFFLIIGSRFAVRYFMTSGGSNSRVIPDTSERVDVLSKFGKPSKQNLKQTGNHNIKSTAVFVE